MTLAVPTRRDRPAIRARWDQSSKVGAILKILDPIVDHRLVSERNHKSMMRNWLRAPPWPGRNRYNGIRIKFVASHDEGLFDAETQAEIAHMFSEMEARGLKFDPQGTVMLPKHVYNGEVILRASKTISPSVLTYIGLWLQAKPGRRIQIKTDEMEIEASTTREARDLLKRPKAKLR